MEEYHTSFPIFERCYRNITCKNFFLIKNVDFFWHRILSQSSLIDWIVGPLLTTIQLKFGFFCVFKRVQIGFSPLATCICIWHTKMYIFYALVEHVQYTYITSAPKYHNNYYTAIILSCKPNMSYST